MKDLIVAGIISGLTTGIILSVFAWFWQRWVRFTNTEELKVAIVLSSKMQVPEFKFGLLHASNDDGMIINRVYWFRKEGGGKLYTAIRHPRNIGLQYKCFVDHGSLHQSDEVSHLLALEGFKNPSPGGGKPNRVWFILSDKPTAKDAGAHTNNHFYPE